LERLRILHELDMGVIEGKPFKNISKLVLHRLRELLDFEVAGLFKLDEDRRNLIVECSDGKVKFFEDGSEVPFTPIAMENLKKGEISYVRNLLDLEHHTELEMGLLRGGMRSYVHVPLVVRRELVGVLCLAAGKSSAFDGKLKFIKEISDQLAIAFHEAELFEMKVRSLKRLEKNVEEFAILVDHIRNPLSIISGTIELEIEDENVREVIDEAVKKIEDVVSRLDRGWLESEQIRDFLKKPRV
jgi:transcriptional regulator with GAF, ATPase, and Fis domain